MIPRRGYLTVVLGGLSLACTLSGAERGRTVLFASGADLQSINSLVAIHPLAKQVQKYVLLTTLARYDSLMRPQPYLATGWEWSLDRRLLTLTLYSGLRWADGTPTTARDAAWTIGAARNPVVGYPRLSDLDQIEDIHSPDDTTLVLTFTAPQRRFPDVLTDLAILPAHLLDSVPPQAMRRASWNEAPIGNGPFRFVVHEPNRRWVFTANPEFPEALGGPPRLERFLVVVVDEPTTKLAALTAGELDFAGISPGHADFVRRDPRLAVVDYPLLFTYGMVFNTTRAPLGDVWIRQAVSLAIDRQQIVDGYIFGFGSAANGPLPPDVPGGITLPPPRYDPDSARALLQGRRVSLELLTVGSGEAPLEQMLQAQLARVGIEATIRQLELSAFLDRVYGPRRAFETAVMGMQGDLSLGFLRPLVALTGGEAPDNPSAIQQWLADSLAIVFLYHARGVQGMNRRVRGVMMDLRGELPTVAEWFIADARETDAGR